MYREQINNIEGKEPVNLRIAEVDCTTYCVNSLP